MATKSSVPRVCLRCGQAFLAAPWVVRRGNGLYCSGTCQRAPRVTPAERFWAKVTKSDGCWLWEGLRNPHGYGIFTTGGHSSRNVLAHRFSYSLNVGPVPRGLFVLHGCDVRPCVRPDHLSLGTAADNAADMVAKGRGTPYERRVANLASRNRLSFAIADEMRSVYAAGGVGLRDLARRYGTDSSTASKIVRGIRWRTLTG